MSALLNRIASDDFIWDALCSHLPRHRQSATAFRNFDCPMCTDTKKRCGIKRSTYIGVSCFNCGFAAKYKVGDSLSRNMREFLFRIGIADSEVKRLNHQAYAVKRALADATVIPEAVQAITFEPNFPVTTLPEGSLPLLEWADAGCTDPMFVKAAEYAFSRGEEVFTRADFHWTPLAGFENRLIMPFRWKNRIVGYTGRAVDGDKDKYKNFMPPNFLFNSRVLDLRDREFVILVEGPMCAIAIDGVSPLGSKLNEKQTVWLKNCGKRVIVVPDRDEKGQKMIDIARKNNWAVTFPHLKSNSQTWWDNDIADTDDAVKRHGRLYVLKSILECATTNGTEIEVKRKYLV